MARSTATNEDGSSEKAIAADDVSFNAKAIAGAWEAVDEQVPVCVAVAITNEFTDHVVTAADGVECDRDVVFGDAGVLFEEKAVGVCSRETAEQYAPAYVELERDDGFVLAINPAQIFDRPDFKHREEFSTTPDDEPEIVTDGGQDVVESLGELDEDAVYRYENAEAGSDRHTFTVNLDWIEDDDFADYGEGSVGFNYRDGYVADVPVSNVEEMIEDGRIVVVEPAADEPDLVTDGGVDLPAAQDVDLWDVEEGDEIHLPGGTVLEIVEAIHHSRDFGDDSHRFRARKPSGHVVRLESHNLETAFASGGELIKPPTQNPDAIPVDDFYYGDSPRWLAVRHRIEYVRRNQYGRDFVTGEKIGQSVVAVDPDDAAV